MQIKIDGKECDRLTLSINHERCLGLWIHSVTGRARNFIELDKDQLGILIKELQQLESEM